MYFFSLLITMFSLVPFGFIRLFVSHSLWILHIWRRPVYLWLFFFSFGLFISFIRKFLLVLLHRSHWSDSAQIDNFCSVFRISSCPLISKLLLVLCNFIFPMYPFFGAFVVTLMRIINSIGGGYLYVSLCCFVCSYLRQKYFLCGWA